MEISNKHLASLLPNQELNEADKCCYVLAMQYGDSPNCVPLMGTGALYQRCFAGNEPISLASTNVSGGIDVTGLGGVALSGNVSYLDVYNNNSPFEGRRIVLAAFVESGTLFSYIERVKLTLMVVTLVSLLLGVGGILLVSRRFASPITALSRRVRGMETQPDFQLERLGITEIDQLVDAIEELNRNVGRGSARTEFFSRMSHDMRTPMNAIISFSSPELLEGASPAVKDDYLQKIHTSGQYLLALINEVLDMTKIESNKIELHKTSVQVGNLFDMTIPIIEKLAQKREIHFIVSTDAAPQSHVIADVQHLNQIVMNLLSNAVKFTPEGGIVKLDVSLTDDPDNAGVARFCVTVSDNGIGMSEEFLHRLYIPFEQENSCGEGTGLGLTIARRLVELMDGTINCQSSKGHGTVFTVSLPLQKDVGGQEPTSHLQRVMDPHALQGKRILVCEDNHVNMLIIRRLLEKWGIDVTCTENGKLGLDAFSASPEGFFDAILMDVRMPVMDGLAAAQAIRALPRGDAGRIPIIAMTANAFEADEQASRAAGMNLHLAKPVEPDVVFAALSKYLNRPEPPCK